MNIRMWKKAMQVIPNVTKEEWDQLDIISKWLIATRAAVLIMTALSGLLAGIFAWHDGLAFNFWYWVLLILGLVFAHAANNLFNDFTDYIKGVDKDNYFRTMYGPQPVADGLLSKKQHLRYFFVTGLIALFFGVILLGVNNGDIGIWLLIAAGAFCVLFYTWPLKYIALGEITVLIVWGPLMIGGGYYVLTGLWSWNVVLASLPYVFGVTTVIFGKHIDKIDVDREKSIHTLPVLIGEKASRTIIGVMMIFPYILVLYMIFIKYFSPIMIVTVFAIPTLIKILPQIQKPRPHERPDGFPEGQGGWPLYFAPQAFINNKAFGMWFLLGLIFDGFVRVIFPLFWH